jgi:protein-tyrosine phosphatase/arsenate reductase
MNTKVKNACDQLSRQFDAISPERKQLLAKISNYIQQKKEVNQAIQLVYVCTHNSRRSHFGQIWAAVAAEYFGVNEVTTFSGGTEATAFNPNAIHALNGLGFEITTTDLSSNPKYEVDFGGSKASICFSKGYDDASNPSSNFAAIMTCGDAEENCPFIPGVELRIGTTYEDPKAFDDTELQDEKYTERALQIGLETLYVFSKINYVE